MEPLPLILRDLFIHAISVAEQDGLLSDGEVAYATKYLNTIETQAPPQKRPLTGPPELSLVTTPEEI